MGTKAHQGIHVLHQKSGTEAMDINRINSYRNYVSGPIQMLRLLRASEKGRSREAYKASFK